MNVELMDLSSCSELISVMVPFQNPLQSCVMTVACGKRSLKDRWLFND